MAEHQQADLPHTPANNGERVRQLEARLREFEDCQALLAAGAPDLAIVGLDAAGTITTWSPGARRLLGYESAEAVGQPVALLFTPADRAAGLPERELRTAADAGSAADENWAVRKDGSHFWAAGYSAARRGPGGELLGFVKTFRDLTEREQTAQALTEGELRLRAALAAADMGTWLWQVPTDKQTLDHNLHRLMGLDGDRTVHDLADFLTCIHPDDRVTVRAAFERSVREGAPLLVEFRVVRPDGTVRWLRDKGEAVRDARGQVQYVTGACVDVTVSKQMEEELRAVDRRKDEFLAMLGHELRNPLAPLRSLTEVLRRGRLEGPELERACAMMDRQVAHLTRLVDDLLDVARITRGLVELRHTPVNLGAVAEQAAEMAGPALDGRGHELSLTLPGKPVWVEGDRTRLTQVVFNLLNNAAKYTEPGGQVALAVAREGEQAVVRVRDNGTGIAPALLPRVFDLFTQGERGLDRAQGGLGLGLALVKRLAEQHGGSAEALSAGPGQGSEFVIRLPALAAAPPPLVPAAPPPPTPVARALVVDDNPDVAESLVMLLDGLTREVRVAHGGAQAVELARAFAPQLVLCDLGMPGMDGYETCRRLRQLPGLESAVILAVSGYGAEEDRRKSRAAGFDQHLVKPIRGADLEEVVRTAAAAASSAESGP